jgi:hypothetical protein
MFRDQLAFDLFDSFEKVVQIVPLVQVSGALNIC